MSVLLIIEIQDHELFNLEIKRNYKSSRYYKNLSYVYDFKIHVSKRKIEEIIQSLAIFQIINNKFQADELCIGNFRMDAIIVDGVMLKYPYIQEIKIVKTTKETENESDECDIGVISGTFSEKRRIFSEILGESFCREF